MNHEQQPATSIKASLVATNENRFITLPSPPSFNILLEKIAAVFNLSTDDEVAVRVHYVDDESDRVTVSSDDELACALFPTTTGGRPLRLFVSTTTVGAATQPAAVHPAQEEQTQSTDAQPTTTTSDAVAQPTDVEAKADDSEAAIDALKRRLTQQGIEVCEKRCVRVLAKFGGEVDKALAALERCHERKQLRLAGNNRKCPDPAKLETLHQQREARRAERLATRLARQEQKKQLRQTPNEIKDESAAKTNVDAASAKTLVALMAELGLAVGKGRCTGALRRADGDIDAAKADLVAWCAKRQEHKRNKPNDKTTAARINDADQGKLLGQLD